MNPASAIGEAECALLDRFSSAIGEAECGLVHPLSRVWTFEADSAFAGLLKPAALLKPSAHFKADSAFEAECALLHHISTTSAQFILPAKSALRVESQKFLHTCKRKVTFKPTSKAPTEKIKNALTVHDSKGNEVS